MQHYYTYEQSGDTLSFSRVILLSQSPRRKQLLHFLNPTIQSPYANERAVEELFMSKLEHLPFLERAAQTCCEISKAKCTLPLSNDTLYISADTIVIHKNTIYNKPTDKQDAYRMLKSYFGQTHHVVTSVCLKTIDSLRVFYCVASVTFVPYYDALEPLINDYIHTMQPLDKAGAYGIQEIDARFIQSINGDINTIIGLPVSQINYHLFHE